MAWATNIFPSANVYNPYNVYDTSSSTNIGVVERARSRGVARAMAARSFLTMAAHAMRFAGYTLVLDDNWPSRRTAESLGARVTGNFVTYRRDM